MYKPTSIRLAVFAQRSRVTDRLTRYGIISRNSPHYAHYLVRPKFLCLPASWASVAILCIQANVVASVIDSVGFCLMLSVVAADCDAGQSIQLRSIE